MADSHTSRPGTSSSSVAAAGVKSGEPIEVYLFPGTDHGMVEFVEQPDGSRQYTRITDGYLKLVADWIKGEVGDRYGRGVRLGR